MLARNLYAAVLAAPTGLEDFDTALSAVTRDQLAGRVSAAEAVELDRQIRIQREEHIMRTGG